MSIFLNNVTKVLREVRATVVRTVAQTPARKEPHMQATMQDTYKEPYVLEEHPQDLRLICAGLTERVRAFMAEDGNQAAFEAWKKQSIEQGNPYGLSFEKGER